MATFIKYMVRVGAMEENAKNHNDSDKTLSILFLRVNKLHVLLDLYFSTYKLQVNILWHIKNTFSFFD